MFIGRIRTPWTSRLQTPRQGRHDGPICRIEVFDPWVPALDGLAAYERVEVLYWLHLSRRDLVRQSPANDGASRGTFSLRSPVRPNPIGTALARLVGIEGELNASGSGSVSRSEKVSLTIAAVVTDVLSNGNLVIQGRQEVRTNREVRELTVAGIVRPEDISSANTIAHTQIAEARISYGGRGDISRVQASPAAQSLVERFSPF